MGWQRDFIEELRRTKFRSPNPLAAGYNRTIQKLSVEIYQNDMHFVKEIIQNAEDNTSGKDVRPSLEFFLTSDDVAEMCVPATLLVLNNEKGLTRSDVEALCDMSVSTKKGKRDKGYIGCKGIGFKSVFMVSKTPIIISNGFRICFSDEPSELGVGYIVPEWMDCPTDNAILAACGRGKLPNTVLILPLRHNKVDLVRRQLKGISPENILFLSKIKELHVVVKMKDKSGRTGSLKIMRSEPIVSFERQLPLRSSNVEVKVTAKMFKVNLTVECDRSEISGTFPYMVFQGLFPVTHRDTDGEREEVSDWAISLAFPEVKRAPSHAGDVFSFLPLGLRTGFPFIINADFLLTASRDTIKFDEPWNIGILGCIPAAFEAALKRMILPSKSNRNFLVDRRHSYKFLPVSSVHGDTAYRYSSAASSENRQVRQKLSHIEPEEASDIRLLKKVRDDILQRVGSQRWIFLSSPGIDNGLQLSKDYDLPAKSCLLIKSVFRKILQSSAQCNHPAPSAVLERARNFSDGRSSSGSMFGIVDGYVQQWYAPALEALGVSEMTMAQYKSFLLDSDWLSNLPDKIYIRVLSFVAFELKLLDEMYQDRVDLLKIRVTAGGQELISFARLDGTELLYTSSIEDAEWIYAWIKEFSPWDSVEVMPAKTSQALIEASNSEDLIMWIRKRVTLTELNVQKYAQRLIEKITGANAKSKRESKFSVLVLQFLYSGIRDKKLSREFVVQRIENLRHVIVFDDKSSRERSAGRKLREEGGVLLPAVVSKWPTLFAFCNSDTKHLIVLSDRYLDPQCSLVENIVNKSGGPDSMLEFVKEAFNAVDLPSINLPAGELVTFRHPVTLVQSVSMLEWLKVFLPGRKSASRWENDRFLRSVKEFAWVKTYHHGWQLPTSVFFSIGFFQDRFTAHDLPFLDVNTYAHLNLIDDATQLVFEELSLVTDVRKENGCAAVVKYISSCSAKELDLEAVSRFYTYLDEVASLDQICDVNIWIPAGATSEVPMWKDPAACIISDELGIFADSRSVTVLDKVYDGSLVPEFFNKLQVPEKASGALHCSIWLEWSCPGSCVSTPVDKVKDEDGCPRDVSFVSRVKVEHVLKDILANWQDYSKADNEPDFSKDCRTDTTEGFRNDSNGKDPSSKDPKVSNDGSSDDCGSADSIEASSRVDCSDDCGSADSIEASGRADCSDDFQEEEEEAEAEEDEDEEEEEDVEEEEDDEDEEEEEEEDDEIEEEISREVWESFHSRAWLPILPPEINELASEANETISIVPPSQALIADDVELTKSFSEATNGKLNFVWFPPSLSTEELEKLNRMYLKMGARKLSELITCEVGIPPDVLKTTVPRGKGLISEGLVRSVLAYLCKNEKKQGLSLEGRHGVLAPLFSVNEVVVDEPFEKNSSLFVETLTAPATITKGVFVHYDRAERRLYSLRKDHTLLKANIRKKVFSSQFVTTVSTGILYDHPELVQGLIDLLMLLWGSKFSTKSLEREFKKQKLLIFPEDEKLLMESIVKFED